MTEVEKAIVAAAGARRGVTKWMIILLLVAVAAAATAIGTGMGSGVLAWVTGESASDQVERGTDAGEVVLPPSGDQSVTNSGTIGGNVIVARDDAKVSIEVEAAMAPTIALDPPRAPTSIANEKSGSPNSSIRVPATWPEEPLVLTMLINNPTRGSLRIGNVELVVDECALDVIETARRNPAQAEHDANSFVRIEARPGRYAVFEIPNTCMSASRSVNMLNMRIRAGAREFDDRPYKQNVSSGDAAELRIMVFHGVSDTEIRRPRKAAVCRAHLEVIVDSAGKPSQLKTEMFDIALVGGPSR